jgi:hypothetical protein
MKNNWTDAPMVTFRMGVNAKIFWTGHQRARNGVSMELTAGRETDSSEPKESKVSYKRIVVCTRTSPLINMTYSLNDNLSFLRCVEVRKFMRSGTRMPVYSV